MSTHSTAKTTCLCYHACFANTQWIIIYVTLCLHLYAEVILSAASAYIVIVRNRVSRITPPTTKFHTVIGAQTGRFPRNSGHPRSMAAKMAQKKKQQHRHAISHRPICMKFGDNTWIGGVINPFGIRILRNFTFKGSLIPRNRLFEPCLGVLFQPKDTLMCFWVKVTTIPSYSPRAEDFLCPVTFGARVTLSNYTRWKYTENSVWAHCHYIFTILLHGLIRCQHAASAATPATM